MDILSLKNKRILVTGGNGYLGSFLTKALEEEGAVVFIIDRMQTGRKNEYRVDITNREETEKVICEIRPQITYHLAAMLDRSRDFENFDNIFAVNYTGTMNILLALHKSKCEHLIFTSTSEIYGGNKVPFTEDMHPMPVSPYSMTKVFSEIAIQSFTRQNKIHYTILRLFNFFGSGMPKNFFIPELLNSLKNKEIFNMTEGKQARDFLYVDDVIRAMILTGRHEKARNNIFNVCSGKSVTLREFVLECKNAMKSNCHIKFGALPYRDNEIWDMVGDNTKISQLLRFEVKYDISIIEKIIEY